MTGRGDVTLDKAVDGARKLIPDLRQRAGAAEKARRVLENTIAVGFAEHAFGLELTDRRL